MQRSTTDRAANGAPLVAHLCRFNNFELVAHVCCPGELSSEACTPQQFVGVPPSARQMRIEKSCLTVNKRTASYLYCLQRRAVHYTCAELAEESGPTYRTQHTHSSRQWRLRGTV